MRSAALTLLASIALAPPAMAEVSVSYTAPREVLDFYFRSASEREAIYRELAATLRSMGEQLPPGRSLKVELFDLRPPAASILSTGARARESSTARRRRASGCATS